MCIRDSIGICELLTKYMEPSVYKDYVKKFGFLKPVNSPFLNNEGGAMFFEMCIRDRCCGRFVCGI